MIQEVMWVMGGMGNSRWTFAHPLLYSTGSWSRDMVQVGPCHMRNPISRLFMYPKVHCGEGNGTPLQYSCLENPMGKGAWWAAVHGVAKSRTWLSNWLDFHFSLSCIGEGNGNPLQCPCPENPRDGGAWWAAICGVAQSRTWLKRLSSSSSSSSKKLFAEIVGNYWWTGFLKKSIWKKVRQ